LIVTEGRFGVQLLIALAMEKRWLTSPSGPTCFAANRNKFTLQCIMLLKETLLREAVELVFVVIEFLYSFSLEAMQAQWTTLEKRVSDGFTEPHRVLIETENEDMIVIAEALIREFYPKIQQTDKGGGTDINWKFVYHYCNLQ
jgi:hypothetical protein